MAVLGRRTNRLKGRSLRLSPLEYSRLIWQRRQGRKTFEENKTGTMVADRSLSYVNLIHFGKEGIEETLELVRKVARLCGTKNIEVLDEGSGNSTLAIELRRELGRERIDARFTRTDIAPQTNPDILASPEELVKKVGKNKFHIIFSTYGGATYTKASQTKAIANIFEALKPGGVCLLAMTRITHPTKLGKTTGRIMTLDEIKKALEKYPDANIIETTEFSPVGTFIITKSKT